MEDAKSDILYEERADTSVRHQYLAAVIASISTFCYGCAVGWVSPALLYLLAPDSPLGAPPTSAESALTASLLCVGALGATPVFGFIADRLGRRWAGLLITVPYALCWILKLAVPSVAGLLAARVLAGAGGGGSLLVAPLYCSEVGSPRVRGALGSLAVLAINAGILVAFALGAWVAYYPLLWIHLAIPVAYCLGFFFMPETPTFLVKKNRYEEAAKAIAWLRNISPEDPVTQGVLSNLKQEVLLASKNSTREVSVKEINNGAEKVVPESPEMPPWKFFVTSRVTMKAFGVCFVLISIQGYIGIFAINNFATVIFKDAGSTLTPSNAAIIVGALQLIGSYGSILLVERLGRKLLFISSATTVSLAMATLGTYFYFKNQGYDISAVGWIPVLALSAGVCIYSLGAGPVPFVITNEVFMVQARGIATTIVIFWLWVTAFVVSQFYTSVVEAIGSDGTFWAFAVIAMSGSIFCFFLVPETKGKPLDEILQHFDSRLAKTGKRDEVGGLL